MKKLIEKLINRETILYLIFGFLTTAVNYVVFWLVFKALGPDSALIANAVAFIVAVAFAYVTNKLYVFESKSWAWEIIRKEMATFLAARLLSFAIEELGLMAYGLSAPDDLTVFGINGTLVAKIALSIFVIIFNYVASKLVIFKGRQCNEDSGD